MRLPCLKIIRVQLVLPQIESKMIRKHSRFILHGQTIMNSSTLLLNLKTALKNRTSMKEAIFSVPITFLRDWRSTIESMTTYVFCMCFPCQAVITTPINCARSYLCKNNFLEEILYRLCDYIENTTHEHVLVVPRGKRKHWFLLALSHVLMYIVDGVHRMRRYCG